MVSNQLTLPESFGLPRLITRDPLLLAKHAAVDKKRKHDEDSEERQVCKHNG